MAVVGASRTPGKAGSAFLKGLIAARFKGDLFPVNPEGGEVMGLPAYRCLGDIPRPVDNVIVAIPRAALPPVLEDCATKGVRMVQLFTAGFSELSGEDGLAQEKQLAARARSCGYRLLGPNCIGVSRPALSLPLGPEGILARPGHVGFVSQSGSLSLRTAQVGITRGIGFSKIVSFGNGADLDSLDFLEYMGMDPDTTVIGAYLEGVKDGPRFVRILKDICRTKPVVVWKGGATEAGARTAASHTGSLAGSMAVWRAALKQSAAMAADTLEEAGDLLLGLQTLPPVSGKRVTIISGLADGGGGESVAASDICTSLGMEAPPFAPATVKALTGLVGSVGSILHNPLDLSQAYGRPERIRQALELASGDPNIDVVIFEAVLDFLYAWLSDETIEALFSMLIELSPKLGKPVIAILPPGINEMPRLELEKRLLAAGVPSYPSLERAVKTLARLHRWNRQRAETEIESWDRGGP